MIYHEQDFISDLKTNVLPSTDKDEIKNYSQLKVTGFDFNLGVNYNNLIKSLKTTGFQATNLSYAIDQINEMVE